MAIAFGVVPPGTTLYVPFATYDSNGASVTMTGFAVGDISIYKNGGTTARSSTNGYTLLDTDGTDFASLTGIHGFSIDLSDNTDAGFYAAGSSYWIIVSAVTVDSQTVRFIAGTFTIDYVQSDLRQISGTNVSTSSAQLGVNIVNAAGTAWGSGAITAASIATDAITAAKIATDAIDADALAADAVAEINATVDTALSDIGLQYLVNTALPTSWSADITANSALDYMADDGTAVYDRTTDSLQAVRDHIGDGTNLTEAGGTGDHLTAIDLPDQTMNITGNITGNLSGSVGSVTGAVGSVTGAVGSVTGNVGGNVTGSVGSLGTTAKSDVNAEVVDALATDTYAEPGQEAPGATVSLSTKIGYLYKAWRNRTTQTATTYSLYADDATTVDQKATVSDDTTTADKGEIVTGP